jgi:hypothetical protein
MCSGDVEFDEVPTYPLCARLADVELSTDLADRGNPFRRELPGEHLDGLFLQGAA